MPTGARIKPCQILTFQLVLEPDLLRAREDGRGEMELQGARPSWWQSQARSGGKGSAVRKRQARGFRSRRQVPIDNVVVRYDLFDQRLGRRAVAGEKRGIDHGNPLGHGKPKP